MKVVSFEGCDHSGKSTQAKLLAEKLISEGKKVYYEHFPRYGTPIGQVIKDFLDHKIQLDYTAFQMLYAADQTDFVREIVKNKEVDYFILDRYDVSTVVYYLAHEGIGQNNFDNITNMQTEIIKPDLTFIFDIKAEVAMARNTGYKDKHESDKDFLEKVCQVHEFIDDHYDNKNVFMKLRKFVHIDATKSVEEIAEEINQCIK